MSAEPFLGEIMLWSGDFAPRGWAFCNGQIMSISQNTALFCIVGTTYGGDGRVTFALPDLRGRMPMGTGYGSPYSLTARELGDIGGSETLTVPATLVANDPDATQKQQVLTAQNTSVQYSIMPPYLGLSFVIALQGIFPSRW